MIVTFLEIGGGYFWLIINQNLTVMTKNMGSTDKMLRIAIALVIALLYWQNIISGTLALVLIAVSVVFLLTSTLSFCPVYKVFGISTCSVKAKK